MDYEKKYNEIVERIKEFHEAGNVLTKAQMEIILPELADSEDEKIRKEMINYFSQFKEDGIRGVDITPWIAYLEKQKESADPFDNEQFKKGYETGYSDAVKINKPAECVFDNKELRDVVISELNKYTSDNFWRSPWSMDSTGLQYPLYFANLGAKWQKEQKPTDDRYMEGYMRGIGEQKPAEWSEEDEKTRNSIIEAIHNLWPYEHRDKCVQWLKSLHPQPKVELTLLDENIINATVAFVEQNDHFNCWAGIDKHTVIKALRTLKPHWKPSEEQMEMLSYVMVNRDDYCGDVLCSLYDDLKKL